MQTALTLLKVDCYFLRFFVLPDYGLNCRLSLVLYIFYIRNFLFTGEIVDVTCTTLASMGISCCRVRLSVHVVF